MLLNRVINLSVSFPMLNTPVFNKDCRLELEDNWMVSKKNRISLLHLTFNNTKRKILFKHIYSRLVDYLETE